MPLSEHEEKLLAQMEEQLYAEDPRLASRLRKHDGPTLRGRRLLLGGLLAVAGLALVIVGAMSQSIPVGAIGFAVMVGGGAYAAWPTSSSSGPLGTVAADGSVKQRGKAGKTAKPKSTGTFMQRLEQRWDRRRGSGF